MTCGEEKANCSKDLNNENSNAMEHRNIANELCALNLDEGKNSSMYGLSLNSLRLMASHSRASTEDGEDAGTKEVDTRPRHERNMHSRAMRRALTEITPANSHPQNQSPLFSKLPSEVRNLIFEYAICQTPNYHCPVSGTSHTNRPGHKYKTIIDTSLLHTCRLIYYETRTIPLRSTTHHVYEAPSESFNPADWDHYLFHLSSQSGHNLHHLHTTKWRIPFTFSDHLNEHLHWRKMSWTLCASEWMPEEMGYHFDVSDKLTYVRFPDSCREVNVEFESLQKFPWQRKLLRGVAEKCRETQLTKRNGEKLEIDLDYSMEYTWEGTTWKPAGRADNHWNGDYVTATYHVIRISWREKVAERHYMHYDHLDCLRSSAIEPMSQEDIEKDVESI
ncbi:hypothetical protein CC80DRAFT_486895 [Byssothecium circinans]|uniref:F-box domain-containing protein n=1 Tax=Byssothecium circinans TaxID=147558 RepID=A0A6A5UKT4_9PLEO|nr:hypothetical protein CC80DRAFT_486895 [Byssothecium circinans]